ALSVLGNLRPEPMLGLVAAGRAGDSAAALALPDRLETLMRAMFVETNPVRVKAALAEVGLCAADCRLPLAPLGADSRRRLLAVLAHYREELGSPARS